ncbi:hypothetical protein DRJ48_03105 [Candidatus Woesearchaeota archaeon]|nr:MAG: hypothetical protein DRJ48_03105 [Candidatus Woesearchaeota archaeon]
MLLNTQSRDAFSSTYNDNTSVLTKLNVSNVAPWVINPVVYKQGTPAGNNIVLEEGTTINVRCNATINDTNGVNDISSVNATFYLSGYTGAADYNTLYKNTSCTQVYQISNIAAYYSCNFQVWYFANNGTWECNMTALDTGGLSNYSVAQNIIDPLYAINLSTTEIDFGELDPGQSSTDQVVNVTNFGNMNLTIAVKGYGVTDGDGWAMNCTVGNISIGYERYALDPGIAWDSMTQLTSSFTNIAGLTVYQRVDDNDNAMINSTNSTYWKIKAPLGTRGQCNGTLVFSAVAT